VFCITNVGNSQAEAQENPEEEHPRQDPDPEEDKHPFGLLGEIDRKLLEDIPKMK
jgi:hypothetical protein